MLKNLISGLTGRLKKPADAADDEAVVPTPFTELAPNSAASRQLENSPPLDLPATLGFVSHQPVMDRLQRVVAYDFFVRQGKRNIAAGKQQEFDRLMLSTLQNMDIFRLLAFRRAFVHISIDTLDDPMLSNMPASSVIFVLEPSQTGSVSDEMLQQLDTLQRGMRFALEPAAYDPGDLPAHLQNDLFSRMDFMVLDFAAPSSKVLAPILDQLPKRTPRCAGWRAMSAPPRIWTSACAAPAITVSPCSTVLHRHRARAGRRQGGRQPDQGAADHAHAARQCRGGRD